MKLVAIGRFRGEVRLLRLQKVADLLCLGILKREGLFRVFRSLVELLNSIGLGILKRLVLLDGRRRAVELKDSMGL